MKYCSLLSDNCTAQRQYSPCTKWPTPSSGRWERGHFSTPRSECWIRHYRPSEAVEFIILIFWNQETLPLNGLSHTLRTGHDLSKLDRVYRHQSHWKMRYLRVPYLTLFYSQCTRPLLEISIANTGWAFILTPMIPNCIYHSNRVHQYQKGHQYLVSRHLSRIWRCGWPITFRH